MLSFEVAVSKKCWEHETQSILYSLWHIVKGILPCTPEDFEVHERQMDGFSDQGTCDIRIVGFVPNYLYPRPNADDVARQLAEAVASRLKKGYRIGVTINVVPSATHYIDTRPQDVQLAEEELAL